MRVRMATRTHTRTQAGFTLAETMAAMIVVTLLTAVVTTGVATGMQVFRKSSFVSEAVSLEDSADAALQDPMHFLSARQNDTSASYGLIFVGQEIYDPRLVAYPEVIQDDSGSTKTVNVLAIEGTDGNGDPIRCDLLNPGAYTDCTIASVDAFEIDPATPTVGTTPTKVSVTFTIQSTTDASLTRQCTLTYTPTDATRS